MNSSIIEIAFDTPMTHGRSSLDYNPLVCWRSSTGKHLVVPAFHHSGSEWRARLLPTVIGNWTYTVYNHTPSGTPIAAGEVEVSHIDKRGQLRARPHSPWHFAYDDGTVPFLLGDTVYNLVGVAYSGHDYEAFLRKRKAQGFNLIRVRAAVSPYHPNTPFSAWMTADCWLWSGSPQCPDYTRFNTRYLEAIEAVLDACARHDIAVELIAEAWLMEAPFNQRDRFLPEHEELLIRELVARFGAHPALALWCVANEYNLYQKPTSASINDWYARRLARLFRHYDGHRKLVANHVTAAEHLEFTFQERFRNTADIDVLLMQYWGKIDTKQNAALCLGMEDELRRSVADADQSVIMAEYGYETPGSHDKCFPGHELLGPSHNRRGALRSLFLGIPIITGFENTWGPLFKPEHDPVGITCFTHIRKLFTEYVDFTILSPKENRFTFESVVEGDTPLSLLQEDGRGLVYLPMGGTLQWSYAPDSTGWKWFNPRTGECIAVAPQFESHRFTLTSPIESDEAGCPADWVLIT
ncbi:MAG: DUF4038 domain-containing protein [Verrucomicrobiota bacterium]|nr:DUF4038 domain-containing protein [Verrucomicrobiota bacterium]